MICFQNALTKHNFFQIYTLRNDKSGMMLLHKHVTLENVKKSNREVEPKKNRKKIKTNYLLF